MAGGEGSLSRGTAKATAAATGPHGSSKGSSTKRKAAKDPTSCCRMPRPRATKEQRQKVEEAAEAPTVAAGEQKYRLSKAYIRWILALKPMEPPARLAALKRSNPDLTPQPGEEADEDKRRLYRLAKAFFEMEESLPTEQEWVRSELRREGYVELDDESGRRRAEVDALVDREWPAIQAKIDAIILQDKEYRGGDEGDSDEGEDSDESEDDEEDEVY